MGTIICKSCDATIEHFEVEKVTTLYSQCQKCGSSTHNKNPK
jgi:rRNA maturation protein Nop10